MSSKDESKAEVVIHKEDGSKSTQEFTENVYAHNYAKYALQLPENQSATITEKQ